MLCSELLCVRCLPGLDLVTLLLSLLTKYKTRCSFVHSILSTLNCSVRPHTESQYQWEGVLGKQLLCLLSCFCFQRTVILTNPPETGIILTHLIWQTEEWRHTLPLKAVGAWIRAWKRERCPCPADLGYLVNENLSVEICIFCFLQVPLFLLHQVLVLSEYVTEQVAIGTAGLPSGEDELQEMGILQTLPL